MLAALNKALGDGFQLFPTAANVFRLGGNNLVVLDGCGDDREKVGEFLDDFVGGGDEEFGMAMSGLGVPDEKTAGAVANPLQDARIGGAALEGVNAVSNEALLTLLAKRLQAAAPRVRPLDKVG